MPRGDGTGPAGLGPMSGRGMGYCAGYTTPGRVASGRGRGMGAGYGRGFGRGFGRGTGLGRGRGMGFGAGRGFPFRGFVPPRFAGCLPWYPPQEGVSEAGALMEEAEYLRKEVEFINKRLAEIDEAVKELKADGPVRDKDEE